MIGILWAAQVSLFAIGWLGPWRDKPLADHPGDTQGRVFRPIRMILSFSLVVASWRIWMEVEGTASVYARWISYGMMASFVGDLIMARILPAPNRLIGGMLAFGFGHVIYINGYLRALDGAGKDILLNPGLIAGLIFYGAATVVGWSKWVRNPDKPTALNIGALLYGALIGVMASCALALSWSFGGAWWLAAIGGASFVASDFIIGLTSIRGRVIHNANDLIWLTYLIGQMGIIYCAWL